jgi:hypothetical protein
MIAIAKPEPVYVLQGCHIGGRGEYTAVPKDGSLLVYHGLRCITSLFDGASETQFRAVARAHSEGYKAGEREARENIGGAYRMFLLTLGIDLEEIETKVEKLERLESGR